MTETVYIHAPEADFVVPYIRRALGVATQLSELSECSELSENPNGDAIAVMLSSGDIYAGSDMCAEDAPADAASPWVASEEAFSNVCRKAGVKGMILRCADIVGTGMNGFPRALAEAIWRGTFFHFPDNEARRSVVHAVDIAEIIRKAAAGGIPHSDNGVTVYNICDGVHPTIHDFAEALAFRMKNKRISTLSTRPQQIMAKLLYGRRRYGLYTSTRTISADALTKDMAYVPTDVCQYLRTHTYDEDSL